MTTELEQDPEGYEVEVSWSRDDIGTRFVATYGEVTITVDASNEQTPNVAWLAAALPQLIDQAAQQMIADEQGAGE